MKDVVYVDRLKYFTIKGHMYSEYSSPKNIGESLENTSHICFSIILLRIENLFKIFKNYLEINTLRVEHKNRVNKKKTIHTI